MVDAPRDVPPREKQPFGGTLLCVRKRGRDVNEVFQDVIPESEPVAVLHNIPEAAALVTRQHNKAGMGAVRSEFELERAVLLGSRGGEGDVKSALDVLQVDLGMHIINY